MRMLDKKLGEGPCADLKRLADVWGITENDAACILIRYGLDRMTAGEKAFYFEEFIKTKKDHQHRPFLREWADTPQPYHGTPMPAGESSEIEQMRVELNKVNHEATHDSLTGLWNRRAALKVLDMDPTVMVALCDVDDLKGVNDRYGHGAGDTLIQAVAQRLQVAMEGLGAAFRLGGDEFLLIWEGEVGATSPLDLMVGIRKQVNGELAYHPQPDHRAPGKRKPIILNPSISIGVGRAEGNSSNGRGRRLLALADDAMYEAKRIGSPVVAILQESVD